MNKLQLLTRANNVLSHTSAFFFSYAEIGCSLSALMAWWSCKTISWFRRTVMHNSATKQNERMYDLISVTSGAPFCLLNHNWLELLLFVCKPFYSLGEFASIIFAAVYTPLRQKQMECLLSGQIIEMETKHLNSAVFIQGNSRNEFPAWHVRKKHWTTFAPPLKGSRHLFSLALHGRSSMDQMVPKYEYWRQPSLSKPQSEGTVDPGSRWRTQTLPQHFRLGGSQIVPNNCQQAQLMNTFKMVEMRTASKGTLLFFTPGGCQPISSQVLGKPITEPLKWIENISCLGEQFVPKLIFCCCLLPLFVCWNSTEVCMITKHLLNLLFIAIPPKLLMRLGSAGTTKWPLNFFDQLFQHNASILWPRYCTLSAKNPRFTSICSTILGSWMKCNLQ